MIRFMVLSAPRSASTWMANWLTTDRTLCLHDPVLEYKPEALDDIPCERALGIACTALPLLPHVVNAHGARKLIIHRDLLEVNRSLVSIGLSPLGWRWKGALDTLLGMHVQYQDLFDPFTAELIWKHLTDLPFDAERHRLLCDMHVEPQFEKVKVKPERAREFRQRIERAFV